MSDKINRLQLADDYARRLASAIRSSQLYAPTHPLVGRNVTSLIETLADLHGDVASVTIGFVGDEVVVCEMPLLKPVSSILDLGRRLHERRIERIAIDRGVTAEEVKALIQHLAAPAGPHDESGEAAERALPHVHFGRLAIEEQVESKVADMATIRRLYSDAVSAVEGIWDDAGRDARIDASGAQAIVRGLAQAVAQNRSALLALTAVKNYDNYTFTHMVNVSILTMAQARTLGIDGPLLREFGMAGLMHDIGKVRVPADILGKPERLNDAEFAIMRRHPMDGAEILRRTPDIAPIVPLVAFEHHLRADGSGYPMGVRREGLNLATALTSIADIYDAMRSQRAYQQVFPSERVVEVLRRNDGRHFDQHLVRRFVQLLGIYPVGTAVRLNTGQLAVVTAARAADPHRPRVRVVKTTSAETIAIPYDVDLWANEPGSDAPCSIAAPVDVETLGMDPLAVM